MLPWFPELAARAASTEERDPTRALEVPFGMRAGIVTALAGVSEADDPSGMVRFLWRYKWLSIACHVLLRSRDCNHHSNHIPLSMTNGLVFCLTQELCHLSQNAMSLALIGVMWQMSCVLRRLPCCWERSGRRGACGRRQPKKTAPALRSTCTVATPSCADRSAAMVVQVSSIAVRDCQGSDVRHRAEQRRPNRRSRLRPQLFGCAL